MPPAKLIYIGGYGHSGSTLLESLLTASPAVIGCGEIVGALRALAPERKCSCGRVVRDCPVWSSIALMAPEEVLRRRTHAKLTSELLRRVARDYEAIIDSSKTAWRQALAPFQLRRRLGSDFVLVHMVRDPRGVAWSVMQRSLRIKKPRRQIFLCAAAAGGWFVANLACEAFKWMHPSQYHRLRYEDFVVSPRATVARLLEQALPGGPATVGHVGALDNRHQLHGNRMRLHGTSFEDVRADVAWKEAMVPKHQTMVASLCGPLMRRYGYQYARATT
jgi:hypothetical protein